jgi:hypothetical protein
VLRGRLDDAVPRPVLAGHVRVRMLGSDPAGCREFDAEVRADGGFEVANLPDGHGQILALCRGWVSRRTPFDPVESAMLRLGRELTLREIEQSFQEEPPESLEAQRIVVPAPTPLLVAMEPTGSLEVVVKEQDGSPLASARVAASPRVRWIGTAAAAFPWGKWERTTDAWGHARIDDLPPEDALAVEATHEADGGRSKRRWDYVVRISSGQTAELEVVPR